MPVPVVAVSAGLFVISAGLEGASTLAVVEALSAVGPRYVMKPSGRVRYTIAGLGLSAALLAVVGVLFASQLPDGLEKLAEQVGIASHARVLIPTPFADYEAGFIAWPWLRKAAAGLAGLAMIFVACSLFGRWLARRGNA